MARAAGGHVRGGCRLVGGVRVGRGGVRSLAARTSSGRRPEGHPCCRPGRGACPWDTTPPCRTALVRSDGGGTSAGVVGREIRAWRPALWPTRQAVGAGAGQQGMHAAADETDRVRGTPARWSAMEEHAASSRDPSSVGRPLFCRPDGRGARPRPGTYLGVVGRSDRRVVGSGKVHVRWTVASAGHRSTLPRGTLAGEMLARGAPARGAFVRQGRAHLILYSFSPSPTSFKLVCYLLLVSYVSRVPIPLESRIYANEPILIS